MGSSSFSGAAQWYHPVEIGLTLIPYLLQTLVTAATSSVEPGKTTAQGRGIKWLWLGRTGFGHHLKGIGVQKCRIIVIFSSANNVFDCAICFCWKSLCSSLLLA